MPFIRRTLYRKRQSHLKLLLFSLVIGLFVVAFIKLTTAPQNLPSHNPKVASTRTLDDLLESNPPYNSEDPVKVPDDSPSTSHTSIDDSKLYEMYFESVNPPKNPLKPFISPSSMNYGKLRPGKKALSTDPHAVDAVYTYVDSSDKLWQRAFNEQKKSPEDFVQPQQWRTTNELKYSMRSLYKFIKFIHHIYIIVSSPSQIPTWIDPNNPYVTFVYHPEIFPDRSHLPTFSSLTIEANLWRIEGLTNNFIYLNDDFFMARDVPRNYFFNNDNALVHIERYWFPKPNSRYYHQYIYLASQYLKEEFGVGTDTVAGTYRAVMHAPKLLNREAFNWTVSTFPEVYQTSSRTKFRQPKGLAYFVNMVVHSWVQQTYRSPGTFKTPAKYHRCSPSEFRFEYLKNKPQENTLMVKRIARLKPMFWCANNDQKVQSEEASAAFINGMEELYAKPGPWERG
ncbi:hypothetical protein P9112_004145 [Eukaryota sp. TZLM1-RC]